jgi:hypothetical protein
MPTKIFSTAQPPPLNRPGLGSEQSIWRAESSSSASAGADRSRPNSALAWITLVILAGLVAGARWLEFLPVAMPGCGWRALTGMPCPGCGFTRSLLAWSEFQPWEALRLNPLFFGAMVGLLLWAGTQLCDRYFDTRCRAIWPILRRHPLVMPLLIVLLVANWVYLWLTLPT